MAARGHVIGFITRASDYNGGRAGLMENTSHMKADFFGVFGALKFLFIGPLILAFLAVVNLMTSPGDWWIQWPALGIGIAWFCC
jgi:hypothetical protein